MASQKELTKRLNNFLKNYSSERVWRRISMYNSVSSGVKDLFDATNDIEIILVGSLREGIGLPLFNDTDTLKVDHTVVCQPVATYEEYENKTVFQVLEKNAPAGYCYLKLISDVVPNLSYVKWSMFGNLEHFVCKNEKQKYLSSLLFKIALGLSPRVDETTNSFYIHGPSLPVRSYFLPKAFLSRLPNILQLLLDIFMDPYSDVVVAFPCKADHVLEDWKNRQRNSGWPKRKTISQVISFPVYVVPVGKKGSLNENFQWRISFTMAETHLVQSFNSTQRKVYVIVKYLAKNYLNPECSSITSYVIKNVIFWIAEDIPMKKFRQKHLVARVKDALLFLKKSVQRKKLPNYMLPKRNLFTRKFKKHERRKALQILTYMLENMSEFPEHYLFSTKDAILKVLINMLADNYNIFDRHVANMGISRLKGQLFGGSLVSSRYGPDHHSQSSSNTNEQNAKTISEYSQKPTEYTKGPMNMLAIYPYLLVFFLCLPMKLYLVKLFPGSATVMAKIGPVLMRILLTFYMTLFCFVQWKKLFGKTVFVDYLSYKIATYTPKTVQRLEELILFLYIPAFTEVFAFTEITIGVNIPFLCLCFIFTLLSFQIKKIVSRCQVTILCMYRLFQTLILVILCVPV